MAEQKGTHAWFLASNISYLVYAMNQLFYIVLLSVALVRIRGLFKLSPNIAMNEKLFIYHVIFVSLSCIVTFVYVFLSWIINNSNSNKDTIEYAVVNAFMLLSIIMMLYIYERFAKIATVNLEVKVDGAIRVTTQEEADRRQAADNLFRNS